MKISKDSWHYRVNDKIQGYSFRDRARGRKFTTCTYIRTTMRSLLQGLLYAILLVLLAVAAGTMIGMMLYVPLAAVTGWGVSHHMIIPCVVGWGWLFILGIAWVCSKVGPMIRERLSDRYERKLSILEQRVKDGKEGICTIVEVE